MAYVPDDAIKLLNEISPTAGRLYLFFCRWRDHDTGYSRKSFDTACSELEYSRATSYRVRRELLDGNWIIIGDNGRVGLRGGDFSCVDRSGEARRVWEGDKGSRQASEACSLNSETDYAHCLNSETESLNLETANLNPETKSLNSETEHIKDRARVSSSKPSSVPSNTPTPARGSRPAASRVSADVDGVCELGELCEQDYYDFARSQKSFHTPDAWAATHWEKRDRDKVVVEWKAKRASTLEGKHTHETNLLPYHAAAQRVNSVKQAGGDVAAYIDQMQEIAPDTRTRLRATFAPHRLPAAPAATHPAARVAN